MNKLFCNTPALGIIGGMGPMASAYFQELLVRFTDAAADQQHIPSVLLNLPQVPDRTAYILGESDKSPAPVLLEAARTLEALGVSAIAVTCVTSHCFYDEVAGKIGVPWIHAVRETARFLKEKGVGKAGILATTGTIKTGLFQRELEKAGIGWEVPSPERQADVMAVIYEDIKAGREPDMERFTRAEDSLRKKGCDACILGCTELSLIKREHPLPGCTDVLEVLAAAAVRACGKTVKGFS